MKIFLLLMISAVMMFAAINVNTASKEELMSIKGIGEKKAASIMKYRKTHKIKNLDDLKNVSGISTATINNIKHDVKSGDKKAKKGTASKKSSGKKDAKKSTGKTADSKTKKTTASGKEKKKSKNKAEKKSKNKKDKKDKKAKTKKSKKEKKQKH